MSKFFAFIKLYPGPLISGVLIGTTYIPFPAWAVLFCYVPLWLFCLEEKRSLREVFWAGWWSQFILSLIGFYWVTYVSHEFGHLPWPVALLVLFIFAALVHLYIPLSLMALWYLRKKLKLSLMWCFCLLPVLHNLAERLWPSLFPWHLGYTLYSSKLPIYQWADIIGFLGLSLLVLLANAALAAGWRLKRLKGTVAAVLLAFLLLNVGGHFHEQNWPQPDHQLRAILVQANIGNSEKIQAEKGEGFQEEIINKFLRLSKEALQAAGHAEVLVWPETAFPYYLDEEHMSFTYPQQLATGLRELNVPLVTGAYSKDYSGPNNAPVVYNSLSLMDEHGRLSAQPYPKTHLLAYGEYLPFSETFPVLLKWVPVVSNFGRGKGPQVLTQNLKGKTILWGPQICYEGLYPEFSSLAARKGAQIFVNVTNDSWFGSYSEPFQHMYMTFARAIENRRPLVRSTNTGISSVALASGEILQRSPIHQEWTGVFDIPYLANPPLTFFSKWGHLDTLFVAALAVLLVGIGYRRSANPFRG